LEGHGSAGLARGSEALGLLIGDAVASLDRDE